jgi:30S ribosome assembly GTPase
MPIVDYRYIKVLERGGDGLGEAIVCDRCHSLKYKGGASFELGYQSSEAAKASVRKAVKRRRCLVIKVVNVTDVEGSLIDDMVSLVGNNPVLLVGNKVDVLPNGVNEERVRVWLKHRAEQLGVLNIRRTMLVSALTGHNMRALIDEIVKLHHGRDVVVLGSTNSGKSTLINQLMPRLHPGARTYLTESPIPGTTLAPLSFPLLEQDFDPSVEAERATTDNRLGKSGAPRIVDTPGIVNYDQIEHVLEPREIAHVSLRRRIHPKIFRLVEGKCLFLSGLARIDYSSGPPLYFTAFCSDRLRIHPSSIEHADDFYARQLDNVDHQNDRDESAALLYPIRREPPLVCRHIRLNTADIYDRHSWRKAFADISVSGLGWISLTGGTKGSEPIELQVRAPEGVRVTVRPPIMPYEAEPTKRVGSKLIKHGKVRTGRPLLHPLTPSRVIGVKNPSANRQRSPKPPEHVERTRRLIKRSEARRAKTAESEARRQESKARKAKQRAEKQAKAQEKEEKLRMKRLN